MASFIEQLLFKIKCFTCRTGKLLQFLQINGFFEWRLIKSILFDCSLFEQQYDRKGGVEEEDFLFKMGQFKWYVFQAPDSHAHTKISNAFQFPKKYK